MDPLEHAERDLARYRELVLSGELRGADVPDAELINTYPWQLGVMGAHVEALIKEVRRLRAAQAVAA